jgi:hypothetical protein
MKRIGVISDTHVRGDSFEHIEALSQAWGPVDLVLHAGDILAPEVNQALDTLADTIAVAGNMDGAFILAQWPRKKTVQIEGVQLGLIHGDAVIKRLGRQDHALVGDDLHAGLRRHFPQARCIVFGHTHEPHCAHADGVLFLNPGAFRPGMGRTSTGVIEIKGNWVQAKIVTL